MAYESLIFVSNYENDYNLIAIDIEVQFLAF